MKTVTNQLNEGIKIDTNRRNFVGQAAGLGIGLLVANASINPAIAAEGASIGRQWVELFNTGDWDGLRNLLVENVVYIEMGTSRRIEGVDPYLASGKAWRAAFPDLKGEIKTEMVNGDLGVMEIVWVGTHSGPLLMPDGKTVPPTGKKIAVPATAWTVARGKKAIESRHYLDVLSLLAQLGLLPG